MLAKIVKEKRKELGKTQQEIADQLNVTRQTVSSWEVGKSIPDISSLIEISNLYDISLDYMLKGDKQVVEKLKKDTVELYFLRYFSKSTIVIIGILLTIIMPISIMIVVGLFAYVTIFKNQNIKLMVNVKEQKNMKTSTSHLERALTDSFAIIGGVALIYVVISFFTGNEYFFVEERSKITLIVLFIGMTIGRYFRYRKVTK